MRLRGPKACALPAPQNGDEIVAGPIAGPLLRIILEQYCKIAAHATRAIQYYKYDIGITMQPHDNRKHNVGGIAGGVISRKTVLT